jgi:O-methyltransferase
LTPIVDRMLRNARISSRAHEASPHASGPPRPCRNRPGLFQIMKRLINRISRSCGVTISRVPPTGLVIDHHLQGAVEAAYSMVRPFTMLSRPRLSILFEFVQYVNACAVPGAIVECGVWKGGAVGMMANACQHFGDIRDLHLFDAFDDICEPDSRMDGERAVREAGGIDHAKGRLEPLTGVYDRRGGHGTVDACKRLIEGATHYPSNKVRFHQGWFQNTMAEGVPDVRQIAILRIDADWYASTKICLDTLYDRVSTGGVVIVDDYGGYDGCRKAVDEFLRSRELKVFRNHVDEECIYWFRP